MILSMPINYKIDPHRNLIRTQCLGDVNPKEVSDHFRDLASNPTRPNRLNVLLDLTQMTSVPETDQVRGASYELRKLPELRFNACAIVAGANHLFGMMRMFQAFAGDRFEITQAFHTVAEAEAWLAEKGIEGLDPAA